MMYNFMPCTYSVVARYVVDKHYLHRMPSGIMESFVMFDDMSRIFRVFGAAVFTNGRIQYQGRFLDFSRLWVDDCCPRNTESQFVSYCMKYLEKKYPKYVGVVTWADPQVGHTGTLYKACNFTFDGFSRPVERYRNPATGRILYQRSFEGQEGFVRMSNDNPKLRFIYYFNSKVREATRHPLIKS